jgi:signal transduction histidine kinase
MALLLREEARLAAALAERNERLHDLDRLKGEFVASVSHELRTPLTSIRGYLELVLEGEAGELTDEQREFLGIVDRNSGRLLQLVGDLLDVAHADSGLVLEQGRTDLAEIVRDSVERARPAADSRDVTLTLAGSDDVPLDADGPRLAQVADNLISNALKFTPGGGRVEVSVSAGDGLARIDIADTGMGISAADQERLFERFFRTSGATEAAIPGTGLGLSIVQAIVDAHGGEVEIKSEEGRGTTFSVLLPLAAPAADVAVREQDAA